MVWPWIVVQMLSSVSRPTQKPANNDEQHCRTAIIQYPTSRNINAGKMLLTLQFRHRHHHHQQQQQYDCTKPQLPWRTLFR